jgi:predicted TIM-barrel fold metal-dependent hydrolase
MVIDFQHHYIPVELAKKRGLYSETGRTMLQEGGLPATTMHPRLYDLDLQLRDMDEAGVDVSILSCLLGWSAPLEECCFINDDLSGLQRKYPRRFVGLAQTPILDGKAALDELRRAITDLGLRGVTITSQVNGLSLDSPKLYDFYEAVAALDVPVFVHPALVPTGYEHLKDYDLPRVLGREGRYRAAGFVKLASTYPGLLPRLDSTLNQPLSCSTTLSFVPLEMLATTG